MKFDPLLCRVVSHARNNKSIICSGNQLTGLYLIHNTARLRDK